MDLKQHKVLVVDDDAFARSLLTRQLEKFGLVEVTAVASGHEALDTLRSARFDLVLLDMQMPGKTGVEVLQEMKSDLELHEIPVVVVSAADDIDLVIRCIELGAEDYLDKPVNAGLLEARLRNVFERERLRRFEALSHDQLLAEKRRADALLEAILPAAAIRELRTMGAVQTRRFDHVAILFCDVANFTRFCSDRAPEEVVGQLEALFGRFEEIIAAHRLEKIKIIGDAFMAAASLNIPHADPLRAVVECGLEMMAATEAVCPGWESRVGVAEGSVVAGIIGKEKFQFDVWGDTVNVAARMASVGRCGVVTMPQDCWQGSGGAYVGKMLGEIEVKGKGPMRIVECSLIRGESPRAASA